LDEESFRELRTLLGTRAGIRLETVRGSRSPGSTRSRWRLRSEGGDQVAEKPPVADLKRRQSAPLTRQVARQPLGLSALLGATRRGIGEYLSELDAGE